MTDQERIVVLEYELEAAKKRIAALEAFQLDAAKISDLHNDALIYLMKKEKTHDISGGVVVGTNGAAEQS